MRLLFIILLFLFSILTYLYYRFICTLSPKKHFRLIYLACLLGLICLFFLTLSLKRAGISSLGTDILSWSSYVSLGFLSFLTSILLLRDGLLLWIKLASVLINNKKTNNVRPKQDRRFFLSATATSLLAGGAISLTGIGIFLAKKTPEVKKVMLPVKNLPKDLEGFSIVQLSDIHLSSTIKKRFLSKVVDEVNRLKPDVIAITGDLADGVVDVLGDDAEPLGDLVSKHGKFFVTGNHEYYFNAEQWIDKVESLGFKALIDSHELIHYNNSKILMAGIADYRAKRFINSHKSSPEKAIEGAPSVDVKILLAHQPKSVFKASEAGFDIQLSGHTHGGQFFPWQMTIGLDQPYLAGLYKHDDMMIYVSRGTGYWGPPIRLGAPSEITLLKLTAG